jgi:hypothetical protein
MAAVKTRDINLLNGKFLIVVQQILAEARRLGIDLRIVETLRDLARQVALLASGDTTVKVGWHQYGLAFDFLIFEDGAPVQNGKDPRYTQIGEYAESLGCIWGGRFDIKPQIPGQQPDSGHIEFHPGFTMTQYQAVLRIQEQA